MKLYFRISGNGHVKRLISIDDSKCDIEATLKELADAGYAIEASKPPQRNVTPAGYNTSSSYVRR